MPILHHFPLCAHSRTIRLIFAELGLDAELSEEPPLSRRDAFLRLNPAGSLPVLVEADGLVIPGASLIMEYLDETAGSSAKVPRLLPERMADRIEVRRLFEWFAGKLMREAIDPILTEKAYKRLFPEQFADPRPDTAMIRAGLANLRHHLGYVAHLVSHRNWLAGEALSAADLAAAAALSIADYLGALEFEGVDEAKLWYMRLKSRPSFRSLLADRVRGLPPTTAYPLLDF
jgi:glutathione S-transferase